MRVLISAFEPFCNRKINNSEEVLNKLDLCKYNKILLPVSYNRSFNILKEEINKIKPDLVICLGEAINRIEICLERRAINLRKASICDNDNVCFDGLKVNDCEDEFLYSNLNIDKLVLKTNVADSFDAGMFVCNSLFYELLDYNRELNNSMLCGFIHIPRIEKYKSIDEMKEKIELIIKNIMEE